ncbi:MAG TPA: glycolate oxidase subunit GlcF [Alphaproteobacteria bacterium]|jgi:glycolate oxidase iron-sulfur subunit
METHFSLAQLADPDIRESEKILRACVHCGFCTATCPTYTILGDELDSPRGRIYLLKEMLEQDAPATTEVVTHIDRCLSCLSCMTTCPSGVNYMHLVDHGRRHIEDTYKRPWADRMLRRLLRAVLPKPGLFRPALRLAMLARPLRALLPARLKDMLRMLPAHMPAPSSVHRPQVFAAEGARRKRVALLTGCVQQTLGPQINEATVRLLTRHGCDVVVPKGVGCCGAIGHHLGQNAHADLKANIDAWLEAGELDAIVVNASGCGTMLKDYGFLLREDAAYAGKAARISALAKDITEVMGELGLQAPTIPTGQRVAYQSPCSMQHGQKINGLPKSLLAQAGFALVDVPQEHLCCGSAGTYNILQPTLAAELGDRKAAQISALRPDIVASGNIGCMTQLSPRLGAPIVHTVELLDWATGGKKPDGLAP